MILTIGERLKDLRIEHNLTLEKLENAVGISKSALGKYENDDGRDISPFSIIKLARFYEVTTDYLLGVTETKSHPNAEVMDLHLSDEMITLLKSGRINTTLLCELVTHGDFSKLLADVEIYIDGVAAMQIQNLNAWVDVTRAEIIEKYHPEEQDKTIHTLESAHINEGEYFSHRIYEELKIILNDIQKSHRGKGDSAPDTSVATELKHTLKEAMNFQGSHLDCLLAIFCKQTQIRYDKLTQEEKLWLIQIAKKSKLLKTRIPQRGKGKK